MVIIIYVQINQVTRKHVKDTIILSVEFTYSTITLCNHRGVTYSTITLCNHRGVTYSTITLCNQREVTYSTITLCNQRGVNIDSPPLHI